MAHKKQETIHKLNKEVPIIPLVVEDTMEDKMLNIGKVIKGFRENIEDLKLRSMPGTPLELCKGRVRMATKTISNIKKVEGECTKIC